MDCAQSRLIARFVSVERSFWRTHYRSARDSSREIEGIRRPHRRLLASQGRQQVKLAGSCSGLPPQPGGVRCDGTLAEVFEPD